MTTYTEIRAIVERMESFDPHRASALELEAMQRDSAVLGRWIEAFDARIRAALAREDRRHPRPLAGGGVRRGRAR